MGGGCVIRARFCSDRVRSGLFLSDTGCSLEGFSQDRSWTGTEAYKPVAGAGCPWLRALLQEGQKAPRSSQGPCLFGHELTMRKWPQ